eukprot:162068-Prymnesium_polylepis.1
MRPHRQLNRSSSPYPPFVRFSAVTMRSILLLLSMLLASAAAFVLPSLPQPCRGALAVRASLDDDFVPPQPDVPLHPAPWVEPPRVTQEGIDKFHERQRLRASGAPLKVWSKTTDREDAPDVSDHVPVPSTEAQKTAANALFGKVLREDDVPDGFGEGLDGFGI